MKKNELAQTAQALMADHKGLLAMDESTSTCNRRFAALNIPQSGVRIVALDPDVFVRPRHSATRINYLEWQREECGSSSRGLVLLGTQ